MACNAKSVCYHMILSDVGRTSSTCLLFQKKLRKLDQHAQDFAKERIMEVKDLGAGMCMQDLSVTIRLANIVVGEIRRPTVFFMHSYRWDHG